MIETHLLKQLVTFAKCGTLSAASEELFITQPALSRSMQKLEEIFDVKLFERGKNKITLNATGILAVERAEIILNEINDMIEKVRFFERSQHTISFGCCASIPYREMTSLISQTYPEMSINSELKPDSQLLKGLYDETYQLVILHERPQDEKLFFKEFGHERLYLSLPSGHSFAERKEIFLNEFDGQTMLLYSVIGFWHDLCVKKMPNTKFLLQDDFDVFGELAGASDFPVFTSSFYLNCGEVIPGRVSIPILDPEFNVTYWCVCRSSEQGKFKSVFSKLPVKSMTR